MGFLRSWARSAAEHWLCKRGYRLVRQPTAVYRSETSKCRGRLGGFCTGYGLDLGFGGDPISETAIRVDLPQPYSRAGFFGVQLGGDASELLWFCDGVLDYVYSSHLLEDFPDTRAVLAEWLRVLKPGGKLVLFCPNEAVYRQHCAQTGQPYNENHKHADFALHTVKQLLTDIATATKVLHEAEIVDDYSWELVVEKLKPRLSCFTQ